MAIPSAAKHTAVLEAFITYWYIIQDIGAEITLHENSDDYYGTEEDIDTQNKIFDLCNAILPDDFEDHVLKATTIEQYKLHVTVIVDFVAKRLFERNDELDLAEQKRLKINRAFDDCSDATDTFVHEDMSIHDPYVSDCSRFDVNPIEQYGIAYYDWYNTPV